MKHKVWARAQGRCEFEGCSSRFQLEIDHQKPRALGGNDSPDRLRLLCRTHNQQQALLKIGPTVMKSYQPRLR